MKRGNMLAATLAGAAAIGIVRSPGRAAQFSYKLANDQPPSHPLTSMSLQAAEKVRIASNGELEIHVFPSGILGGDPQLVAQTRSGAIELLQIGNNVLASTVPAAALEGIPFAFTSYAQLMGVANGPLGAYIGTAAQAFGLRRFSGSWYGGAFQVQNSLRPIVVPGDLKGLKLRVPAGPIDVATFKAFDALPTVVTLSEFYTALQTHLVDGIEVPLATVENFKFYELVKYVSMTSHSHPELPHAGERRRVVGPPRAAAGDRRPRVQRRRPRGERRDGRLADDGGSDAPFARFDVQSSGNRAVSPGHSRRRAVPTMARRLRPRRLGDPRKGNRQARVGGPGVTFPAAGSR